MTAGIRWDAGAFEAHLRRMAEESDRATRQAVAESAQLIQRRAQQNSSGRPGPNVVTGAHRSGIIVEGPRRLGSGWEAIIRGTRVYSGILETRYPWLGPALDWARSGPVAEVFRRHWARAHR